MTVQTNLSRKAMLAVLNISRWTARKHDKRVTEDVKVANEANGNVGKYHKRLLPGDSKELDRVRKAADAARDFYYTNTLPWGNDGSRILPNENYFTYITEMRKLRTEFDEAAQAFIREYPNLRDAAKYHLGKMWLAADYPTIQDIESKFSFDIKFLPFPDAEDFRVSLSPAEQEVLKEQLEQMTDQAAAIAMRDAWQRLFDAVSRMVERLSQPDAIFRDTLVSNVQDLCDLLPKLNVSADANLTAMVEQVKSKLTKSTPDTLRENSGTRSKTAMDAAAIMDMMKAYMPKTAA